MEHEIQKLAKRESIASVAGFMLALGAVVGILVLYNRQKKFVSTTQLASKDE